LALGRDHSRLDPLHLFSAMLNQQGGTVRPLLAQAGFDTAVLRNELAKQLDDLPKVQNPNGDIQMSPDMGRLLNLADKKAQDNGDAYISSENIVLVAAEEGSTSLGKLLLQYGDVKKIQQAIEAIRGGETVDNPDAEENRQALEKYTIDLTSQAESGNAAVKIILYLLVSPAWVKQPLLKAWRSVLLMAKFPKV